MPSPPPIRYPQPGTVLLGKYCVESVIGEGGMGVVLKARHLDLDESVAIKVLLQDHMSRPDIVQRFLREARASVKLKGEHVARVLDVGRLEDEFVGTPYIVMEFLDGADLNAIIKHHGAQDPAVAADLMLQACEAIAEAHSLGIIHRDIKASNFFITQPEEQAPELKVLDFGIATAPQGTSDLTSTQSVIGTPAYMAPEQMRASRQADTRSDVWSMGVVLYELLEGARPFRSTVYSDLCLAVGMDPPEPMEQAIPDALHAVVLRCLEKTVERRYQSVAELAFDLVPFATDPVLARASAEQCARLLGRRGQRAETRRATGDVSPRTPTPRTPTTSQQPAVEEPRAPTGSEKTPTSIHASNGEVTPTLLPPRLRNQVLIAGAFVATAGLGAGLVFLFGPGRGGSHDASASHAVVPADLPSSRPIVTPPPAPEPAPPAPTPPAPTPPAPTPPTPTAPTPTVTAPRPTVTANPTPTIATPADKKTVAKPLPVRPAVKPPVVHAPKKDSTSDPDPGDDDVYKKRR